MAYPGRKAQLDILAEALFICLAKAKTPSGRKCKRKSLPYYRRRLDDDAYCNKVRSNQLVMLTYRKLSSLKRSRAA